MVNVLIGALLGVFLTSVVWLRPYQKLQREHCNLLAYALQMQIEYFEFRRQFNEYRARFDPVDLTRDGNVTYISKGKDDA